MVTFESILIDSSIRPVPCSVANPQSDATLERAHDVMKTSICTEANSNPPADINKANAVIDRLLSSAIHAVCTAVHRRLFTELLVSFQALWHSTETCSHPFHSLLTSTTSGSVDKDRLIWTQLKTTDADSFMIVTLETKL